MSNPPTTSGDALREAVKRVRDSGSRSPRLAAVRLLATALGVERADLLRNPERQLTFIELRRFNEYIARRVAHEPVAYIRHKRAFRTLELEVTPAVLIPRPETETLVDVALGALARVPVREDGAAEEGGEGQTPHAPPLYEPRALDVGTGSGCVALALAAENPFVRVTAVDVDKAAAEVAQRNATRLGLGGRVRVLVGDLLSGLARDARFDVIVSNPPYVPADEYEALEPNVREFEPRLALHGGEDGLDVYRRLVPQAACALAPGGVLAVEVGAGEAAAVGELFAATGLFQAPEVRPDLGGIPRVVWAARLEGGQNPDVCT
jgi:release factor glutamine methyltransferase